MKTSYAYTLIATALVIGFLAAHTGTKPISQPPVKEPASYDFGALDQLTSFVTYLQETKQTNISQKFETYLNASMASQANASLGMNTIILKMLREGDTNHAYSLLEGKMDCDIVSFVACYRRLPTSVRDQPGLTLLAKAKDYRAKYPSQQKSPELAKMVEDSFKILEEKP